MRPTSEGSAAPMHGPERYGLPASTGRDRLEPTTVLFKVDGRPGRFKRRFGLPFFLGCALRGQMLGMQP